MTGFPVVIDAGLAPAAGLEELRIKACQNGTCRESTVSLVPGSDSIDLGCASPAAGADPGSAPCSASASPNGTLTGQWITSEFGTGPITVEASAPGFGPYRGTVTGVEVSSGTGSCRQSTFQTELRITADGIGASGG